MWIKLLVVGKLKESYWRDQAQEMLQTLRKRCRIEVIEIEDEPDRDIARAIRVESEGILQRVAPTDHVILFDLAGKPADRFFRLSSDRVNTIVIGGSNGVDDSIRRRADASIALTPMTLPHQLVRIVALDMIIRRL